MPNKSQKIFEQLNMLAQGSGLFRVDDDLRSKKEKKELESHPWAARLKRLLQEAGEYGAHWVYFRLHSQTGGPRPEIFIFDENDLLSDGVKGKELANLHKQLWNYGAVPLAFFIKPTGVDVFNLMSPPEFDEEGLITPKPFDRLELSDIETLAMAGAAVKGLQKKKAASWERFNSEYFDDGGFWDMPMNRDLGDADQGALESMVTDMRKVRARLTSELSGISNESERDLLIRRILIVILMVQFLKERGILPPDYFQENVSGSDSDFLEALSEPKKLISALDRLEDDFNGDVFHIDQAIRKTIANLTSNDLLPFVNFADPKSDDGQLHFWDRYSFRDLPVEVISYVYEEFLGGKSQSYFTPHHLVDLLLDECMSPEKTRKAFQPGKRTSRQFRVLDPACGSGVFLVGAWKRILEAHVDTGGKTTPSALKALMVDNLHGVDLRAESVELTVFSLSIALCSAFKAKKNQPRYLYEKLRELKFPNLKNANVHEGDFFTLRKKLLNDRQKYSIVIGNPPFESFKTKEQELFDQCGDDEDGKRWPKVPFQRLEYLFLRGAMPLVAESGCACLVQPASFLYNINTLGFRRAVFENWHVPEILDFTSIPQLFRSRKETGDRVSAKTIAVLMEKSEPVFEKPLLHATFRRAGLDSRKYFEIDPQDLHWIRWETARANQQVWKANLLGGGRLLDTYLQLTSNGTLEEKIKALIEKRGWMCSQGLKGPRDKEPKDDEIEDYKHLPEYSEWEILETSGLNSQGLDGKKIKPHDYQWFERPRDANLYKPPHILLKENSSLPLAIRKTGEPLLFRDKIVGISAPSKDVEKLEEIYDFLRQNRPYVEFFAAFGPQFLIGKQTALLKKNLMDLPYPERGKLEFRGVQKHLRDDVIDFMIPLIKGNENTRGILDCPASRKELTGYSAVFLKLMQSIYEDLKLVDTFDLGSAWCIAFQRGDKKTKCFDDPEILRDHLDSLLINDKGQSLRCFRVIRHFSDDQIYIVKPKSRRYWLRSTAIRDADEMFAWVMGNADPTNRRKRKTLKK